MDLLPRDFYRRDSRVVAPELLNKLDDVFRSIGVNAVFEAIEEGTRPASHFRIGALEGRLQGRLGGPAGAPKPLRCLLANSEAVIAKFLDGLLGLLLV